MKLLTQEIINKMPALYATDGQPKEERKIIVKFFTPDSNWNWYVLEGEKEGEDWRFFGLVEGFEKELGYFMLSELQTSKGPIGLHIERDMYFGNHVLSEFMKDK